ncbi:diacylglycerol/lipid kinase family protein [Enterococcus thailandicus]|uniref:diacylglycerol/lipid kinase family protein n=1 Tax=Enterococcus thailandicus TaxID=417368 RepID=UPI00288E9B0A|nr:diacylglycerol kinase family lipid kinase [Enterococcus thailandicus]MDT2752640.1 diacylglycerol kinase family lipid kinase [Enterococcus thailandicus]MDT2776160.1 diacylglycerol kinase family lipid kinase [Enterococcus thailandicus]
MNFHYHLLINRAAGSGNGQKVADKMLPIFDQYRATYSVYYSEYPGHDAELAEQLAKATLVPWITENQETLTTFPLLVIVGGDGTLHQVLNTFYQLDLEFPVAYVPAGSGNDFARGIGLSRNTEQAVTNLLNTTEPQEINLLTYQEQVTDTKGVLVNNLGIGLDAAIVHATNHSATKERLNKYNLGSLSYILSILRVFFTQKGFPILVDVGGKTINFEKAFLCTTTNHPYFGGGVAIAPTAEAFKPTIDFVVVERINLFKIIWIVILLLQKKQLKSKNFHHFTTSKLRIVSTTPQFGQADGEDIAPQSFDLQFGTKNQSFWCQTKK